MVESKEYNSYKQKLLGDIKKAVLKLEPKAEIYLFGSRARGDFNEDSDWDLLILLNGDISSDRKFNVTKSLVTIEILENVSFNRIYFTYDDWLYNKLIHATPFYENVSKDSIKL